MKFNLKRSIRFFIGDLLFEELGDFLYIQKIKIFHKGYFSLTGLDRKIEKYLDHDQGYYVELGANNGFLSSNSFYFELKRNWRGMLVEPAPHNYMKCCRIRSRSNAIFCNACVAFDYKEKYVDMSYANAMTISENLDLDLEDPADHLEKGRKFLRRWERQFKFGALAKPLTQLLDEGKAPSTIDFLSLDVEGAELDVLKGIDFTKYRFKYLLIESRDPDRIREYLKKHNYTLTEKLTNHDYLFQYEKT